jgi:hypothetical protein
MKNKNALIIIAKNPQNGSVKTRLKGSITDEKILELYTSLLEDTIQKFKVIPGVDTIIAYAPDSAEEYFSQYGINLIPLSTCDLGLNMYHAFKEVFNRGYKKAALAGADIPDLTIPIILEAFDILSDKDLVYGPAKDGGYYLVGMRKLIKEVFENVPWSSDQTLKRSIEQAHHFGYSVGFIETLSDIDTIEDVKNMGFFTK